MKKRKIFLFCACLAAFCMGVPAAQANLFDFHYGSLDSSFTYATGAFNVSVNETLTAGSVSRLQAPVGVAEFDAGQWGDGGDFSMSMSITNIGAFNADATGSFTITDVDGDTITGDLAGTWLNGGGANFFIGSLSNVVFTDIDDEDGALDGHDGTSISMDFAAPSPWSGSIMELSTTATWFSEGDYTTDSGSTDASVVAVPIPAAALLGLLGFGVAGIKLRKYV